MIVSQKMKTYRLGSVVLQIPESFVVEARHPLPYPIPHGETASAMVSLLARSPDGSEVEIDAVAVLKNYTLVRNGAVTHLETLALKEGRAIIKQGDVVWFRKEDEVSDGFVGWTSRAAIDTHLVTITATLPEAQPAVETHLNVTVERILGALKLEPQNACLDEKLWRVVLGASPPRDFVSRVFAPSSWDHENCCICFHRIGEGDTYWENSTPRVLCLACHSKFQKDG